MKEILNFIRSKEKKLIVGPLSKDLMNRISELNQKIEKRKFDLEKKSEIDDFHLGNQENNLNLKNS